MPPSSPGAVIRPAPARIMATQRIAIGARSTTERNPLDDEGDGRVGVEEQAPRCRFRESAGSRKSTGLSRAEGGADQGDAQRRRGGWGERACVLREAGGDRDRRKGDAVAPEQQRCRTMPSRRAAGS